MWSLPPEQALAALGSDERGLTPAEAATRLGRFGANELEVERGPGAARILLRQFASPLKIGRAHV